MALETYSSWNFNEVDNFFSAANPMDTCLEPWSNCAFKEINPLGMFNSFTFPFPECPSSVGIDLEKVTEMLISQPEATITPFNESIYVENTLFCSSESDILSSITESDFQHDEFLVNPLSPNFMSIEEVPVQCEASEPQIVLPCHVGDEAEKTRIIVQNLLKAWAEAVERQAWDLAKVVENRLRRRMSLTGSHEERMAYYCLHNFRDPDSSESANTRSLKELCTHTSMTAFQALCQLYPYARFAHFTANQGILERFASNNAKRMHIIDFDVAEGMQWPPLMEALAAESPKTLELLRITAVVWDDDVASVSKTGSKLAAYAASVGIPLYYEEIRLENLRNHMLSAAQEEEQRNVSMVFNLMLNLPHMRCQRSKAQIVEFLSVARGMPEAFVTWACAGVASEWRDYSGHLSDTMDYFCAMLESVEAGLPDEGLARTVMENTFLAPKISRAFSCGGAEMVERELMDGRLCELPRKCGFRGEGAEISEESMAQARDVLSFQRGWHYTLQNLDNQVILKWRDTPLVWASTWR
ncbi:hypothetical protein SUGI_0757470 [Cryptomeria japonica]|uniref:protein NODULATION SIGNALING PATHWAY 2-like n=1 Tax=Cryptomeria japonica TaxID=3369 RepID=UPI0024147D49|nr:protein NODULATION SIGNALING PATHWAY 2-like [Cryptomeria japonica]GLJ37337.1 hypothetical protein SUGI_0757470 [Cryptomeria japonica]